MKVNIKARIRRNKFEELAGKYYQDETSAIVRHLIGVNKKALLGIQREDGIYTIIGEESIYFLTPSGIEGEISHAVFLNILKGNAMSLGKSGQFQYVNLNEQDSIWLLNGQVMNAIWNLVMLLHDSNKAR